MNPANTVLNSTSCLTMMNFCSCRSLAAMLLTQLCLLGCATSIDTRVVNVPKSTLTSSTPPPTVLGEKVIGLSLSGGGMRAAAFSFGVLQALAGNSQGQSDVIDDLGFISSVSGGSLLAAYYGLNGRQTLGSFRSNVLLKDMERGMRLSPFSIVALQRLFEGGLNDRSNLANWLHSDLFNGATFAQLKRRPRPVVWINATDVYNRTPFVFTEQVFDALCSDLASFSVAEAVHASMAVPLVFTPVVLETFAQGCSTPSPAWVDRFSNGDNGSIPRVTHAVALAVRNYRNPLVQRYVKLVDGGVTDNYGLSSIAIARAAAGTPFAPMRAEDVINLKHMLFIVVDSGRSPSGDWALKTAGPSGLDLAVAATDSAIDSATRISFDAFKDMLAAWEADVRRYRCNLKPEELAALRDPKNMSTSWKCDDVRFEVTLISFSDLGTDRAALLNQIPTRLTLPVSDIDAAISAGRDAAIANPALRRYRMTHKNTSRDIDP